jgi:uncharacterized protein YuzE
MKVDYDRATDSLTVVFIDAPVEESDEIRPGVILDFDAEGRIVGMEILDASQRTDNPAAVEFSVKAA